MINDAEKQWEAEEAAKEQQYNRTMARLGWLVLLAFVIALCGGGLLFIAAIKGILWLVYAGVFLLFPFCLLVAAVIFWPILSNGWHISQDYQRWQAKRTK